LLTLWLIEMPYAFGTFIRIDLIDLLPHEDSFIRTLRFAHIAIDAVLCDF
jgi:hypothetical protein